MGKKSKKAQKKKEDRKVQSGNKGKTNNTTVAKYLDHIIEGHLTGNLLDPAKKWNQIHGDRKSQSGGRYHVETMKDSRGKYLAKRVGLNDIVVISDENPEDEPTYDQLMDFKLFPIITHDQHRTYNQNHYRLQTTTGNFWYYDTFLLPASNPSGYPKIITERYNYSTGHISFAMIDALAAFLYSLQYDILGKFMDVEAHPRAKVLRFNRDIGGNDIYVERDRRCITCWSTEYGCSLNDSVDTHIIIGIARDRSWKLVNLYSSLDILRSNGGVNFVQDICQAFAAGFMNGRKKEESVFVTCIAGRNWLSATLRRIL
ncbi:MAG: hypothetical protein Q9172_007775 [Xanthocarpia lactea]